MKYYTIGQIFKLGLLKNYKGEPYKQKATISRIVSTLPHIKRPTPFGVSKVVSEKVIAKYNDSHILYETKRDKKNVVKFLKKAGQINH